jgi:hypothetical protein
MDDKVALCLLAVVWPCAAMWLAYKIVHKPDVYRKQGYEAGCREGWKDRGAYETERRKDEK